MSPVLAEEPTHLSAFVGIYPNEAMSDIAKQIASIEPLTGQANYRIWSLKVKSLAFVGTCWDAILGTDTTATSEEADKRAHYHWGQGDTYPAGPW